MTIFVLLCKKKKKKDKGSRQIELMTIDRNRSPVVWCIQYWWYNHVAAEIQLGKKKKKAKNPAICQTSTVLRSSYVPRIRPEPAKLKQNFLFFFISSQHRVSVLYFHENFSAFLERPPTSIFPQCHPNSLRKIRNAKKIGFANFL